VATDSVGANPIEEIVRYLGIWALRFLLMTLFITPFRLLSGFNRISYFRRPLGLFSCCYAALHALSYIGLDQSFFWPALFDDILKRMYILLGALALVLLLVLAVTSINYLIRVMGGRAWKKVHYLVYPASFLAVAHFYMMTKADFREPFIYAVLLLFLIGFRIVKKLRGG
jgi:sulfoxide reductase heme-binding subunit YedZ